MKLIPGALAALTAMSVMAGPSAADERDQRRGAERWRQESRIERGRHDSRHARRPQESRRREVHRFNDHDSGRWHRGSHAGRSGWWWIVGGVWNYFPAPVHAYPNTYQVPLMQAPLAPPASHFWYYCTNPPGYYPTVPQCRIDWQRVPATVLPGVVP